VAVIKVNMGNMLRWISDRRYTIIGGVICAIAGFLIVEHCIFNSLGMDKFKLFGNVLVNTVLAIGIAFYRHGQKKDAYKNYSEE
jgi:hypothetical protein